MVTPQQLTSGRVLVFFLPLAATWLMMACEVPVLAAVIARMAEPKLNLAAYGVAFSLALIAEAPIIMIMSASTALVRDRGSYLKLRNFTNALNLAITLGMAALLIPPLYRLIALDLIGLPPEVARLTYVSVIILLPWPGTIGARRFYQGILIRHGHTRRVAYGTVVRISSMGLTALVLSRYPQIAGAWVGAAALSVGVTLEAAISRLMAHRTIATLKQQITPAEEDPEPLSYRQISLFYYPLALTALLSLGVQPVITFFVGNSRAALESLAVLPVIYGLVFLFRSIGLAYQEVGIALIGDQLEGYTQLRRFATWLGLALTAGLCLIVWTPLSTVWFHQISGLSTELTGFALVPARTLSILPGLAVWISFQRAMLVNLKATTHVTWATAIEVAGVVLVLFAGINIFDLVGATAACLALTIGRSSANLYLIPPLRKLLTNRTASDPAGVA
jgi:hypothetical protein